MPEAQESEIFVDFLNEDNYSDDGFQYSSYEIRTGRNSKDAPPAEIQSKRFVSCWCCNGSGVVPSFYLRKLGILNHRPWHPAIACQATGCPAGYVTRQNPDSGGEEFLKRFSDGCLDETVSRESCDYIGVFIRSEAESAAAAASLIPTPTSGAEIIRAIVAQQSGSVPVTFDTSKETMTSEQAEELEKEGMEALHSIFGDLVA